MGGGGGWGCGFGFGFGLWWWGPISWRRWPKRWWEGIKGLGGPELLWRGLVRRGLNRHRELEPIFAAFGVPTCEVSNPFFLQWHLVRVHLDGVCEITRHEFFQVFQLHHAILCSCIVEPCSSQMKHKLSSKKPPLFNRNTETCRRGRWVLTYLVADPEDPTRQPRVDIQSGSPDVLAGQDVVGLGWDPSGA